MILSFIVGIEDPCFTAAASIVQTSLASLSFCWKLNFKVTNP